MDECTLNVLLVDDDENYYLISRDLFANIERVKFELEWASTYDVALEAIRSNRHDVYLFDYRLGDRDGLELLREVIADECKAPIIMLADREDHEVDIEAMKSGAADYLVKDGLDAALLERSIRHAIERKRAEKEIAAKNRDLKTLLYVISHDLKEPLRTIESFSSLVSKRYAERLDEKGQDFLRRIVRGVDRLRRLLDDLLMLSRAREMEPPVEEVDGAEVVNEALNRLEAMIKRTGAQIQVAKDLPRIRADETWATQALYNLIANALKFTNGGAVPEVEIAPYRPDKGNSRGTGLVVRDRGMGVPLEHAERIFQLFQRAVGREIDGTGAGLAIVREIAERHSGHAWVRPRQGGGSEFIITFGTSEDQN